MQNAEKPQGTELLEYVLQVSRRLAEHRSLGPLLSFAMDESLKLVGGERGYIVIQNENGTLDFHVGRDQDGQDIITGVDQISRSILKKVVESGKPLQVSNAMTDPRFGEALSVMELRLRSVMCVPLISRQRTVGAIYVENRSIRNRFRQEDIAPLELFANQAAVAIENASLNDELNEAHSHLQELDRLKSDFVILVSHELKTPLTIVNASAQMMKKLVESSANGVDERVLRTGMRLEKAIGRMNKTLEEIIQVFSIVAGQLILDKQEVAPRDILREIVDDFAQICADRQITIHFNSPTEAGHINADVIQLHTVFANIISNAIKYTRDGRSIWIDETVKENGLEITIRDEGIGIPFEEQKRVFDLFHVLGSLSNHSTSKHAFQGGGLGLGLPIAKAIVEAHGGTIFLESEGRDESELPGTTCRIFFPFDP